MTTDNTLLDELVDNAVNKVTASIDNSEATIETTAKKVTAKKATQKETETSIKPEKVAKKTEETITTTPITDGESNSTMGALLEKSAAIPSIGEVMSGTVLSVTSNTIYLDLGALGTGIVLGREMKDGMSEDKAKIGDVLSATVIALDAEEEGYIELSVREASCDKAWDALEEKCNKKTSFPTKIHEANKGGLIVEVNGVAGFLPVSQLSSENYPRVEDGDKTKILDMLKQLTNKELNVCILDCDRENEKLIVSEKAAGSELEREAIAKLKVGDEIEGEISGVVKFGAFIKFFPPSAEGVKEEGLRLEGLVHISELAWQLIEDPRDLVKPGDKARAKVIGIDDTRISLSMKSLARDPWDTVTEKYNVGDFVDGKVDKITHFGAFVYLDNDIHGLAHVSEFRDLYPGKKLEDMIVSGETYKWKILSVEPKTHRMGLLLYTPEMLAKEKGGKSDDSSATKVAATDKKEVAKKSEDTKVATKKTAEKSTDSESSTKSTKSEDEDLTKIEGIGPKIAQVLADNDIATFAQLADTDTDKVREILTTQKLAQHDPETWSKQAEMARDAKWDELTTWQDKLKGGKVA